MVNYCHPQTRCVHPSPPEITPAIAGDETRENIAKDKEEEDVITVLQLNKAVVPKIANISFANLLLGFDDHPANVAPE